MQQIIKKIRPLNWMMPLLIMATVFIVSCNNEPAKTEEPKVQEVAPPVPPPAVKPVDTIKKKDSLPPLDPSAKSRPEPRKTTPTTPVKTQ